MRERRLTDLYAQWRTRPGMAPARFIYVATDGANWRVHATENNGSTGIVLLRKYYRDKPAAMADVAGLLALAGGPDAWVRVGADDWAGKPGFS